MMDGPFKGKYNGQRKYEVDFTNSNMKMGTYHFLDGCRIRVFYRGNTRTCGRCHSTSQVCPGGGIAKDCQEAGGRKVLLSEHMRNVWATIGFNPTNFELPDSDSSNDTNDKPVEEEANTSQNSEPQSPQNEPDEINYTGLSIANISLDIPDGDILKFINDSISSNIQASAVTIVREKKKSVVNINHLFTKSSMRSVMANINFSDCKQKFFGRPLYCRPLRNLTPEKVSSCSTPVMPARSITSSDSSHHHGGKGRTSAFDVLMKAANTCKRGPDELSSPNSPQNADPKKSKPGVNLQK